MRRTKKTFAAARVLGTMAAALMVAGCATKGDMRNLQRELRDLAVRQDSLMQQLRREARSTQDTVRVQSDQLFDFRGDISRQLRELNDGMRRLEAITGENQRGISGIRDQLANMRRMPAGAMGDTGAPAGGDAAAPGAGGGDPAEMYNAGVRQFNRGSNAAARAAFQSFLQAYPTHELAPEAHFKLADILVQEGRPEDALAAFQQIPELFPAAPKVPDALYRIGLLQDEMGDRAEARATLTRVVNTYPDSGAATLAAEKLREIGR